MRRKPDTPTETTRATDWATPRASTRPSVLRLRSYPITIGGYTVIFDLLALTDLGITKPQPFPVAPAVVGSITADHGARVIVALRARRSAA